MWRTLHRSRGANTVGASQPGDMGPFGWYGADDLDLDDGQDDEHDQDHDDT